MFKNYIYKLFWFVLGVFLTGCVGPGPEGSSSSVNATSSSPMQPSSASRSSTSSRIVVTPPSSSSSVRQSSSQVPVTPSSSSALTSSSVASNTPVACDSAAISRGEALYNSCTACHGVANGRQTSGGIGGAIGILAAPYGTAGPTANTLDGYIENNMATHFRRACDNGNALCADDIAAYLYNKAGQNWCAQTSSVATQSSSSQQQASSSPREEAEPVYTTVLSVNTGGEQASDHTGYEFDADKGFTGGTLGDRSGTLTQIPNTKDHELFGSERWGASTYELNLANGKYDIELGFIEMVPAHVAGSRVFDVLIEGDVKINNLDVYSASGGTRTALVRRVSNIRIADGKLNLEFKAITHNPTISYIKVLRLEYPGEQYNRLCSACHGDSQGDGRSELGDSLVESRCDVCGNKETLTSYIDAAMPLKSSHACTGQCAKRMANFIHTKFAGYGSNPPVNLPDFLDRGGNTGACATPEVDFNYLRRVSSLDYNAMVADLFNVKGNFTTSFLGDDRAGSFLANGKKVVEAGQVKEYFSVAEKVSIQALAKKSEWMPCTAQTLACAKNTIKKVGRRAFRRPLTNMEVNRIVTAYEKAKTGAATGEGFDRGVAIIVQSLLTSPNFLYYVEKGQGSGNVVKLTQYELAARLALFFWRSVPDDTLLDLAENNELETDDQLQAQATRMLADTRSRKSVALFHKEWLKVEAPEPGIEGFNAQVAAMVDFNRTVNSLVFNDEASYKDLFTVNYGFFNDQSKALYNVGGSAIATGSGGYDKYTVNRNRRAGLLARAPFLRTNHSATTRGLFLRQYALCDVIPSPPDGAVDQEETEGLDTSLNPRERFSEHSTNPSCGGCHALMDPLGFPLDNYDDLGRWRDKYGIDAVNPSGFDIDTSGGFVLTDIDGTFNGLRELQELLTTSNDVKECYNFHWFEYAIGREATVKDTCSLGKLNDVATASGGSIKDVMTSAILSDAFRNRRTAP